MDYRQDMNTIIYEKRISPRFISIATRNSAIIINNVLYLIQTRLSRKKKEYFELDRNGKYRHSRVIKMSFKWLNVMILLLNTLLMNYRINSLMINIAEDLINQWQFWKYIIYFNNVTTAKYLMLPLTSFSHRAFE